MGNCIAVPNIAKLRAEVVRSFHAPAYAGHFGVNKTFKLVARHFWWPGMRKEVTQFVRTCDSCQRNKPSNQAQGGLLQPLEIPDRRWECVTMDLITSLPKTTRGHD